MHSIRTKIVTIVLVFLAFLGTAFVLYSMATTTHYKNLRLEGIEKTVEFETEKVNKSIAGMERSAVYFALEGLLFYKTQSKDIGETSVLEYLRSFPAALGGGFWFEPYAYNRNTRRSGIYAFFDRAAGEVRLDDTFILADYDYHSQDWYREIVDAITKPYQVVWTKPYADDTGSYSLMTTAGSGIFGQDGRLIAISTVDWEIEKVVEELTAIKPTKNSFVLLCVPEKDYIISSTRTSSVTGASIKSLPWNINAGSFVFDGITYLRFGRLMDNGWLLSIQIPKNEIFAEVEKQNSRFMMLTSFVSILTLGLAYFLISRLINDPIKRLTSDVAQLAFGNLDIHINMDTKDELGLLAQTFNKMTGELKKSIEENARERAEKERISTELSIATEIQAGMLPCVFPPFPSRTEFDLYASMLPAKEVGGDFYDFYMIDKNNLAIVIADVSGKGIPAALFMVVARTLIKNCSACKNPGNVFKTVNKKLCENNEASMFVTAFMGLYNIPTGKIVYVNAGHNPPLLKRGNSYEFLKTKPNVVLGWMEDVQYKEEELVLEPGGVLYLYTDGVTEAMDQDHRMFSEQRLHTTVNQYRDSSPKDLLHAVKREVDNFTNGAEQADDITMLALKVSDTAEGPAGESEMEPADEAMKKLKVEASIENLDKVLDFVNAELGRGHCSSKIQGEIDVVVEEIFTNIANYAYKPDRGDATVFISVRDVTVIRFEDTGKPYNPLEQENPNLDQVRAEQKIGGLGVFLVKKLMDTIEYTRTGNKNVLVMTKEMK